MITLYHGPKSCSVAVKAILQRIGVEHEISVVNLSKGEQFSESYMKINPLSKVPALEIDGQLMTEGGAINSFLAESYPDANLMPAPGTTERREALRWLFFMYGTINPIYARIFMPGRYSDNEESAKRNAEEDLHRTFALVSDQLRYNDFIAGRNPTLADYYLLVAIYWEKALAKKLTDTFPPIKAYQTRMLEDPIIKSVFEEEYLN